MLVKLYSKPKHLSNNAAVFANTEPPSGCEVFSDSVLGFKSVLFEEFWRWNRDSRGCAASLRTKAEPPQPPLLSPLLCHRGIFSSVCIHSTDLPSHVPGEDPPVSLLQWVQGLSLCHALSRPGGNGSSVLQCCGAHTARVRLQCASAISLLRVVAHWTMFMWVFFFLFKKKKKEFNKHQSIEAVWRRWKNLHIRLGNMCFWRRGRELGGGVEALGWAAPARLCPAARSRSHHLESFCWIST